MNLLIFNALSWEQRKLGDIVERITRKNENFESILPLTISAQYGLIDQNEFFDKRIASKDVSGYYLVRKGEFAYNKSTSSDAPWGAIKRLDRYESGVLSTLYIVFRILDEEKIDSDYLVTYYDTDLWHKGVQAIAAEGARNHGLLNIAPADFFETTVLMPQDIEEQRKIGAYFKNLDCLITLHQSKCYGRLRHAFLNTTISWEQRKLGETFDFLSNNTLSRAELSTETGPAMNVHYGDVLIKFGEYLDATKVTLPFIPSQQLVDKFKSSLLQDGDVIMADTAEDEAVGKCTEIAGLQGIPTISGLHTIPLRPMQSFAPGYLGYYMNSGAYHDQLLPLMQGIKVTSVSKSAILNTDISYPDDSAEQARIGRFFIQLDTLITLHQKQWFILKKLQFSPGSNSPVAA